jgi:hypothetical protein
METFAFSTIVSKSVLVVFTLRAVQFWKGVRNWTSLRLQECQKTSPG